METESLEESLSSCHKLENKHRTRVKEPLPLVQGTSLYSPAEESQNESETNWYAFSYAKNALRVKLHKTQNVGLNP